ncbi:MAG: O-antigen ligase family protein [bacterium]|nr:O-antigen ligase family protein [bacterium]
MHQNLYLVRTIKWGLMATLFLPLVVANNLFFPFITGKNFLFRVLVEILFLLWAFLLARDSSYRPKKSWIFIFVIATLAVLTLSTVFGADANRSLWSNFERMEGLIGHIHLFLFFLMLISVFKTERDWWWFFHVSFAASLIIGFYALLQLAGTLAIHQGNTRIDATLGNATYLAVYLLFHLFLLLYYYLKTQETRWKVFYGAVFLFQTILLYYTATRGAMLGFLGGLFVFGLIFGFSSPEKKYKRAAWSLAIGVLVLAGGFYLLSGTGFVKNNSVLVRFSDISIKDAGNQSRLIIWRMAYEGFKERPVLGWGLENFNLVFNKYYEPKLYTQEPWFDRAHNAFFDWLIAGGILGLLAYLGIFASTVLILWKKKNANAERAVFLGLLAAYFFQNLFVFDQLISYILFFAVLAYIHTTSLEQIPSKNRPVPLPGAWANVVPVLAVIIFVFSFYVVNVKAYLENRTLMNALRAASEIKIADSLADFKKAIAYNSVGTREAREQLAELETQIAGREDIPADVRKSVAEYTVSELKKQLEISPTDSRYYLFLSVVYSSVGDIANSYASIKKALEYSPKKQQIMLQLVEADYRAQNYDRAIETMQKLLEMSPGYPDAVANLILIEITAEKDQMASDELAKMVKSGQIPSDENLKRWANAYAVRKQFDKVIAIYQELFKRNPKDQAIAVSLASAFIEAGSKDNAIAVLQQEIAQNPDFKAQGEQYIQQLRGQTNNATKP